MAKLNETEQLLKACLQNAQWLVESAKSVMGVPGASHIAYHLAALALEEIGKSALIFQESLDLQLPPRELESRPRSPLDWMENHERKLFWAIWLPAPNLDWRAIPRCMELAKEVHGKRLRSLYFHPDFPEAQRELTAEEASRLIALAEVRVGMERLKKHRELAEEDKTNLQWFFAASGDPQIAGWIYSKESLQKQAELADEPSGWIRWLRGMVEESERAASDLARREMERVAPQGDDRYRDKWSLKIRLKSWSHSIHANQLAKWNNGVDKIKLFTTDDRHELIVQFTMPKSIMAQDVWAAGMQNCMIFVTALNIATIGFFWWYVPEFISRFHETITDLESNSRVDLDRSPQLKIEWPRQTLREEMLLQQLPTVFNFVVAANGPQREAYSRYFRALSMLAKNDIFFQFEHHLVDEFIGSFEMALHAYGDWDGDPSTFDAAVAIYFNDMAKREGLLEMLSEMRSLATGVRARKIPRPITLEDAVKSKVAFDTYIGLKAAASMREELRRGRAGS